MGGLQRRRRALLLAQGALRLRCATQRAELISDAAALRPGDATNSPLAQATLIAVDAWRRHPALGTAAVLAAIVALGPRRLLRWAGLAGGAWAMWRRWQPLVDALRSPPRSGG